MHRYRLAQEFAAAEATQLALGFLYGAYRFERYRACKNEMASLEPPPTANMAFVTRAAESLRMARDWINTPAGDFGPAQLAAAARQVAERHQASFKEWIGAELLTANFPAIHAVGRASSEAPRLIELRWMPPEAINIRASHWSARGSASTAAVWTSNPAPGWR